MSSDDLTDEHKENLRNILLEINTSTLEHLSRKSYAYKELDEIIHKVYQFIADQNGVMPRSLRDKIFRFMKDLHESIENLHAIHSHRTPISLKAYCEIFIYIFPLIYAPSIIYNIGVETPEWITYFIVLLTEFILISLYNIQSQLEYPFDNIGMDDINLDSFRIERE